MLNKITPKTKSRIKPTTSKILSADEERQFQLQRSRLHHFLKGAWDILEPRRTLEDNWHLELIAEYLELVSSGELKKVLINIAPRSLKSIECSVAYPCWDWIQYPERRFLCLSYSASLANDLSDLRRSLIRSDWYQQLTEGNIRLSTGDRNSSQQVKNRISEFANNHRGQMLARGFDGSVTGSGGDRLICFPGDTLISTEIGLIRIDQLSFSPEVRVLSLDHDRNELEYNHVIQYECFDSRPMVDIDLGDRVLTCTEDHPIYVIGKGYIKAVEIQDGDEVVIKDDGDTSQALPELPNIF